MTTSFDIAAFAADLQDSLVGRAPKELAVLVMSSAPLRTALQDFRSGVEDGLSGVRAGTTDLATLEERMTKQRDQIMTILRGSVLCSAGARAQVGLLLDEACASVRHAAKAFKR